MSAARPSHDARPYLSFVATARNDNHGGDMMRRLRAFVHGLAEQCQRHAVATELVLVEWNPSPEGPGLRDAVEWPRGSPYFSVRLITVPASVHSRLPHADQLGLFQMIAKNVGIRRARGEWIVSTNIDCLFSDPLMAYLARRELNPVYFYRSDRIDVAAEVPESAAIHDVLAWCEQNVLRSSTSHGMQFAAVSGGASLPRNAQDLRHQLLPRITAVEHAVRKRLQEFVGEKEGHPPTHAGPALLELGFLAARQAQWAAWAAGTALFDAVATRRAPGATLAEAVDELSYRFLPPPPLHYLNCGDFMLLSREGWELIGGHPELPIHSLHQDSLTLAVAFGAGLNEARLPPDMVQFHIEHDVGCHWPDRRDARPLYAAVRRRGVPILTWGSFARMARVCAMERRGGPRVRFSDPNWGHADLAFVEQAPCPQGETGELASPSLSAP